MANSKKIFRDPIYDLIAFDKVNDKPIIDIINSPEFQRLRRIRQLGMGFYTYSSALHDRFSHSIGVCYMVGMLVEHLKMPNDKIEIFDPKKNEKIPIDKIQLKLLLQLAGLLHDIGHGPFSHAFERITKIDHEDLTKEIIKSTSNSIAPILKSIDDPVLKEYAVDWIVDIIDGDFKPMWVKELISSQLDADRMDYLLRDAYMCGVSYSHFDWKWIFENMEIREHKSSAGPINERLVINGKKGIYSLESFIISRYHMHEQVYYHKTTRGFEGLVKKVFERVKYLIENPNLNFLNKNDFINDELFAFVEERVKNQKDLSQFNLQHYLELDDFLMFSQFKTWAKNSRDTILKELCNCLILRIPFKLIHDEEKKIGYEEMRKISDAMGEENFKYYFFEDDPTSIVYKDTFIFGGDIKDHIWLINDKEEFVDLSGYSELITTITNKKLQKERAYCHPKYKKMIDSIIINSPN